MRAATLAAHANCAALARRSARSNAVRIATVWKSCRARAAWSRLSIRSESRPALLEEHHDGSAGEAPAHSSARKRHYEIARALPSRPISCARSQRRQRRSARRVHIAVRARRSPRCSPCVLPRALLGRLMLIRHRNNDRLSRYPIVMWRRHNFANGGGLRDLTTVRAEKRADAKRDDQDDARHAGVKSKRRLSPTADKTIRRNRP